MHTLKPNEIGVMFWAGRDHLAELKSLGVRCGQLGIPGSMELDKTAVADWKAAIAQEDFTVVTVVASYIGEDYADIPTVQRTVGFIPQGTREEREKRTIAISDFAAELGVRGIACHIGFVPEDRNDPDYVAVRDMVRRICDHAAQHLQTFALETGQEPAHTLLAFFEDVARPNLRINFDPANMILYGTGNPIDALKVLAPHVVTVHCKDGDWPPKDQPDALGTERPLGQGSVDIPLFVKTLREVGYAGPLNIEREAENQTERIADIKMAVGLLESLS